MARPRFRFLKQHRNVQLQEHLKAGPKWEDNGLIFPDAYGRPQHPARASNRFGYHVKKAGLPGVRFHDLRHTHASLLLQAGVNPKIVQERLGHESITTTMDTSPMSSLRFSTKLPKGWMIYLSDGLATVLMLGRVRI